MTSGYSVLRNVTRADIRRDPYPHIVVENCLSTELYGELARTYPEDETIHRIGKSAKGGAIRPNSRHDLGAYLLLKNAHSVSQVWQEFVGYHVSNAFFQEFLALMGPEIKTTYPGLETRLGGPLQKFTTGVRYDPDWIDSQVALDCHIGINTPARRKTSVRRVHTDAPDELFAMLLYFRREDDKTPGGDLEIYQWKADRPHLFIGSEVDESDAQRVSTIPYKPNTLVIFINSENSLHAVSARAPSPVSRRLVNIMGRVHRSIPEGLFEKKQKTGPLALGRRALQRYKIARRF